MVCFDCILYRQWRFWWWRGVAHRQLWQLSNGNRDPCQQRTLLIAIDVCANIIIVGVMMVVRFFFYRASFLSDVRSAKSRCVCGGTGRHRTENRPSSLVESEVETLFTFGAFSHTHTSPQSKRSMCQSACLKREGWFSARRHLSHNIYRSKQCLLMNSHYKKQHFWHRNHFNNKYRFKFGARLCYELLDPKIYKKNPGCENKST